MQWFWAAEVNSGPKLNIDVKLFAVQLFSIGHYKRLPMKVSMSIS